MNQNDAEAYKNSGNMFFDKGEFGRAIEEFNMRYD